jgi:hypothetical protein
MNLGPEFIQRVQKKYTKLRVKRDNLNFAASNFIFVSFLAF